MNRKKVESIINRFANKEISFGCAVIIKSDGKRYGNKQKVVRVFRNKVVVTRGQKGTLSIDKENIVKVLGHEVYIGDCLEKKGNESKYSC